MFTGATVGIVNLKVVGNLIVELLVISGGPVQTLISGLRLFFPMPPDPCLHPVAGLQGLQGLQAVALHCSIFTVTDQLRISSLISIGVNWPWL